MPVFKGGIPNGWRKSFYYRYTEPGVHEVAPHEGVVTQRYKLAYFWETKEWEMYDRQRDPKEMQSVFSDPKYSSIRRKLEAELKRLREVTGAPVNAAPA